MNKEQIKGKAENLKGRAKEAAGALTGNKKTEAEGIAERVQGALREKVGHAKHDLARNIEKSDDEKSDE